MSRHKGGGDYKVDERRSRAAGGIVDSALSVSIAPPADFQETDL